uniref:TYR_PHOSPHATASE_2 domain-containing protein n=1 Tax=Rhabditophanes sp. KR3021 TaxID=114890 RepID=A0AC35U4S0_9BILA
MNNPLLLLCEPGDISTTVAKENTASSPPLHKYDDGEIQALQVRSKTIPTVLVPKRPRGIFLNEIIWNVDDTVYCGGLEAVINLNVLCRLNIEYVVDLSGSDEESASRRNECPCLCARKTPHSRFNMAIKLNDEENLTKQNLMNYFEEVINLIKKAKACKKCVLIHSDKGRNRAPAFVAAYLMHNEKLTRVQAMMKIAKLMNGMRPGLSISDNFQRALMKWQSHRGIKSQAGQEDTPYTRMFTIKKAAWT